VPDRLSYRAPLSPFADEDSPAVSVANFSTFIRMLEIMKDHESVLASLTWMADKSEGNAMLEFVLAASYKYLPFMFLDDCAAPIAKVLLKRVTRSPPCFPCSWALF